MKRAFFTLLLFTGIITAHAQDNLFGPVAAPKARSGFILNGNASFDIPAGDMAKRFGLSYRIGPAVLYKTKSNWLFGAKFDFIAGNTIKEDSLMINVKDKYGDFINYSGERVGVPIYERGYAAGITAGKIFPVTKKQPDNGVMILTTAGFIQHKIDIFDRDKSVEQLRDNYLKGYDRLTNGAFLEQFAGYTYFAKNGLLNFNLGLDFLIGFTKGRRDYLYDVMRPDTKQRTDILFGLRGGWYIPIFKRKSEDLLFQ